MQFPLKRIFDSYFASFCCCGKHDRPVIVKVKISTKWWRWWRWSWCNQHSHSLMFFLKNGRFHFEDPSKQQPKPQIFIHQLIKGLNQYEEKEIGTLVVAASAPVAATAAYVFSSLFVRLQFAFVAFTRCENGELVCLPSCTFKVDGRGHYLNVQINICFSWA